MKKLLYGSTALLTAGAFLSGPALAAEEGIKLTLGGYMNNFFTFGDVDNNAGVDRNATGMFNDGEVHFKGETTLDNGITFGAQTQLEMFGDSARGGTGDVIDESYAYIRGSFGNIRAGSENSAAYLMHYAAPYVGAPVNSGWVSTFIPDDGGAQTGGGGFRTPRLSTFLDWNNDENVITYFTPRFSGFQLGATYAPTVSGSGDGANFPVEADKDTEFHNGFAVGVNFVESFSGVDVAVAGGYRFAEAPNTPGLGGNLAGKGDDLEQFSTGVNLGWGGFTLGGSYAKEKSGRGTDGDAWDVGVSYGTGPWAVGLTYFQSEVTGSGTGDDELQNANIGVSYAVGPGITAAAGAMWNDSESSNSGGESDGVVGYVGLSYSF